MARKRRMNFTLDEDVVHMLESREDRGERSGAVEEAIKEYYQTE